MTIKSDMKLVVFDLDGTLTREPNSWGLIHRKLGVIDEALKHAQLFYSNQIDYMKWAELDINLWIKKRANYYQLKKIIEDNIQPINGAEKTINILKRNNIETLVISSGLSIICNYFKKVLNYDEFIANRLIFDDKKLLKGIVVKVGFNKGLILKEYLQNKKIPLDNVISIGDNINDIQLFKVTPYSIAFNPKDKSLKKFATYTLETDNLTDILSFILK
ncbi:MAG: HAD-IB family phosphatase [Candidatus Helarchaeota archaeon]